MTHLAIRLLNSGTNLLLKPERATAYRSDRLVTFDRIEERKGYAVPWVIGYVSCGAGIVQKAIYKPSDFERTA